MTPFQIALAVRNRADQDEGVAEFALRTMSGEKVADLGAALDLMIGWERAIEDFAALCGALTTACVLPGATISGLIAVKRAAGYDPGLEAILSRRWRCPHCKQFATIEEVEMPIGDPSRLPRCPTCREDGIAPIDGRPRLTARRGGKSGLRPA